MNKKALLLAIITTFPVYLISYELLAHQNHHPSLVQNVFKIPSALFANEKKLQKQLTENEKKKENKLIKQEQAKEKNSKQENNIAMNIRAVTYSEQMLEKSNMNTHKSSDKKKALAQGDNVDGDIELPDLDVKGSLSPEILSMLIHQGDAYILAKKTDNQRNHYLKIKTNITHSLEGTFIPFKKYSSIGQKLSLRALPLNDPRLVQQLRRLFYSTATEKNRANAKLSFELRLSNSLDKQLAKQQQIISRNKALKVTSFNIKIKDQKVIFTPQSTIL